MKHPIGNAPPRRLLKPRKKVRLNLKERRRPDLEGEIDARQKSSFWRWFGWVAFGHIVVIAILTILFEAAPSTPPPEPMISLLPPGDTVKGTSGKQAASKVGPTTTASIAHHASAPSASAPQTPPAAVVPKTPPPLAVHPAPLPKPSVKKEVASMPPPPKPPARPKVKVDLTKLEDGPAVDTPAKPKPHSKHIVKPHHADNQGDDADTSPDSTGLSREQIAEKLGAKLADEGEENAVKSGVDGSTDGHANPFSDFYNSISEQAHQEWEELNRAPSWDTTIHAVVQIHVEHDGRVPPESVHLLTSSGNPAFDDSAVTAAENLGYLHEPLPEGCKPDISIIFNPKQ